MAEAGININGVLMVLNLLPCRRSTAGGSPSACCRIDAWKFAQLERWGFPILLLLLFTGILGTSCGPSWLFVTC
jgi:hypothetical protein